MVFSSLIFAYIFLPIVIILYYLAKDKYRNYILLIASLYFYSYGEPKFVYVMLGSIAGNYIIALLVDRFRGSILSKVCLTIDIVFNIGILFIYKYLDFCIGVINKILRINVDYVGIALPIGISFFTFQALSYVIDVYRSSVRVQKNPLYLALYISFFPQLIAGPIVRYSTIEEQICDRQCTLEDFSKGCQRFLIGFSKKIILANNLSIVASDIFSKDVASTNPLVLWIGSICFSLQILYDFSGYSDMAIGLGRMFGFKFLENFDYPYISKSVTEFWRRWHMSLGQWFRDYVYIPLGGSRVSISRHIFNMFVVWLLTGIWHGANYTFILWGMGYFVLLVIEKYIVKPEKHSFIISSIVWRVVTLIVVNFGWVIFKSSNWKDGIRYCLAMIGRYSTQLHVDGEVLRYFREYGFFILVGIILSTPCIRWLNERSINNRIEYAKAIVVPFFYGFIFLWAVSYLVLGAHNPFIYFNF